MVWSLTMLLHASRQFFIEKVLGKGKLKLRKVGTHRPVRFKHLMAYKKAPRPRGSVGGRRRARPGLLRRGALHRSYDVCGFQSGVSGRWWDVTVIEG